MPLLDKFAGKCLALGNLHFADFSALSVGFPDQDSGLRAQAAIRNGVDINGYVIATS